MQITADEAQCQALLELLWKQSITGLALVDAKGKFLQANPAFCKITEYTEAELRRKTFQSITDPDDVEADVEMAAQVASGELPTYDMTKSYITKTKTVQPVLLRVTGLRMSGVFTYFVAEVAALEKKGAHSPPPSGRSPGADRARFLRFCKDYWPQIGAVAAGLGYLLNTIVQSFPR